MSAILFGQLLFITAESICFSTPYIINSKRPSAKLHPVVNLCKHPCSVRCSPHCLSTCCVARSLQPNIPSQPVANAATYVAPPKPDLVISSVEEGETEECGEKGIGSPTDDSEDPPGTITIPLPPTMYTPPKPGEQPKELPLPDFKLPASILQGIPPSKSVTLTPLGTPMPAPASATSPGHVPPPNSPFICPPAPPNLPLPPKPAIAKLPPITVSEIPCKIAPHVPYVGNTLPYPKLPPITVSEIPGKIPVRPVAKLPLPPRPPVLYPPPPLVTKLPPAISAENKLVYPSPCPLHCIPECRDDCCTIRLGAPPSNVPGTVGPGAPAVPATVPEAPISIVPGVLEVDPTVISLAGVPVSGYKYVNKPTVDHHIIKHMHQQLNARYA